MMILKKCSCCKKDKNKTDFAVDRRTGDGRQVRCKECHKLYRIENKEKISIRAKEYRQANKVVIRRYRKEYRRINGVVMNQRQREYQQANRDAERQRWRKYYQANKVAIDQRNKKYRLANKERIAEWYRKNRIVNKDKINQYLRKRRKNSIAIRLHGVFSNRMRLCLKNGKEGKSWCDLVDYSIKSLIKHLKRTMPEGYTWNDYLLGKLHIDHKIPISVFNFESYDHIDFKKCWALNNLQLLPAAENIRKKNKIEIPFQPSLLLTI